MDKRHIHSNHKIVRSIGGYILTNNKYNRQGDYTPSDQVQIGKDGTSINGDRGRFQCKLSIQIESRKAYDEAMYYDINDREKWE